MFGHNIPFNMAKMKTNKATRFHLLSILATVLSNCTTISSLESAELDVAVSIIADIASVLALGIILLPLTTQLLRRTGQVIAHAKLINCCALALVVLIFFPANIISNIVNVSLFSLNPLGSPILAAVSTKLVAAYYLMYLVAAIVGSVVMSLVLLGAGKNPAITTVCLRIKYSSSA
jgi:hypothetical protein